MFELLPNMFKGIQLINLLLFVKRAFFYLKKMKLCRKLFCKSRFDGSVVQSVKSPNLGRGFAKELERSPDYYRERRLSRLFKEGRRKTEDRSRTIVTLIGRVMQIYADFLRHGLHEFTRIKLNQDFRSLTEKLL